MTNVEPDQYLAKTVYIFIKAESLQERFGLAHF